MPSLNHLLNEQALAIESTVLRQVSKHTAQQSTQHNAKRNERRRRRRLWCAPCSRAKCQTEVDTICTRPRASENRQAARPFSSTAQQRGAHGVHDIASRRLLHHMHDFSFHFFVVDTICDSRHFLASMHVHFASSHTHHAHTH